MNDPTASISARTGRNQPCPCGSGVRYKQCCGAASAAPSPAGGRDQAPFGIHTAPMFAALAQQNANRFAEAEETYRRVLADRPDLPDALHMLGVVCHALSRFPEAAALIRRAGELTGWTLPGIRKNYGLVLGALLGDRDAGRIAAFRQDYRRWLAGRMAQRTPTSPLVSIVIPSYNHATYLPAALESVYAQTYRSIELVVIDDGSTDDSVVRIRECLQRCPFPSVFRARANRGASETLNEGIRLSSGAYVNPLNSDDILEPGRIAAMVEAVAGHGFEWGFSGVSVIDHDGKPVTAGTDALPRLLEGVTADWRQWHTTGAALLQFNCAVSTGNLFFSRALFDALEGFRNFRYNHDWDFCLRALWRHEPLRVEQAHYRYRLHGNNTIREAAGAPAAEADIVFADYHRLALASVPGNPHAPSRWSLGPGYIADCLKEGQGSALPAAVLTALADELEALAVPQPAGAADASGDADRADGTTGVMA